MIGALERKETNAPEPRKSVYRQYLVCSVDSGRANAIVSGPVEGQML